MIGKTVTIITIFRLMNREKSYFYFIILKPYFNVFPPPSLFCDNLFLC